MRALVLLVAWLALGPTAAQDDNPVTATEVTDRITLLSGAVGNVAVYEAEDHLVLVDSGEASRTGFVQERLKRFEKPVRTVINTHWHYDHRGGNAGLRGAGGQIIAHRNTRALMARHRWQFGQMFSPAAAGDLPDLVYADELALQLGPETIHVRHLPSGHTGGDSVVWFERANVLVTGDLFMHGRLPLVDLNSGGTVAGYIDNVGALTRLANEETRIVPGHGAVAGVADLRAFHQMLIDTRAIVVAGIEAGRSLAELRAASLPERFAPWEWSNGFITRDRWIQLIYSSETGFPVDPFAE